VFTITSAVGVFLIDEDGELVEFRPFTSDEEAVQELLTVQEGVEFLKKGFELFWKWQKEFVEKAGLDYDDYIESRQKVAIKLSEEILARSIKEDESIIQTVETLEDVHKVLNRLTSRFASVCSAYGMQIEIDEENIDFKSVLDAGEGVQSHLVDQLSSQIENLIKYKDSLELEIENLMTSIAPNTAGLVGPLLGAKLISVAKGLEKLARMPASRIQILGAEKAMFRHLREREKPPKHGIIFQHPTISRASWWQRGKIARGLASKLAIAARLDAYSDEDRSEKLKEDFLKRYEFIKKTYQKEPKKMRIIRAPRKEKKRRRR
jgi:nucleolar protein 56